MGMERCGKFMKWSLFGFNFLILIAGCVLLGVGIYTHVDQSGLTQISHILGTGLYSTFSLTLIIAGCLVIVISFFGCCGAIKEVRCMLGSFFILLVVIFTALLVGGIVVYVFRETLSNTIKSKMKASLKKTYGAKDHEPVTAAWDSLQQIFSCCGIEGAGNTTTSWQYYKKYSQWYKNLQPKYPVPVSCCKNSSVVDKSKNEALCMKEARSMDLHGNNAEYTSNRHNRVRVPKYMEFKHIHTLGCFDAIINFIKDNSMYIGGVAIAIAFIMILGMIFSLCLCRAIKEEYELGETYCPPP